MDIEKLIGKMTTEEKAALVSARILCTRIPSRASGSLLCVWRTGLTVCGNRQESRTTASPRVNRQQRSPRL